MTFFIFAFFFVPATLQGMLYQRIKKDYPLHIACLDGDLKTVKSLLRQVPMGKSNPNGSFLPFFGPFHIKLKNNTKRYIMINPCSTPLHLVIHTLYHFRNEPYYFEIYQAILTELCAHKNIDFNIRDDFKKTPLSLAEEYKLSHLLKDLLEQGPTRRTQTAPAVLCAVPKKDIQGK